MSAGTALFPPFTHLSSIGVLSVATGVMEKHCETQHVGNASLTFNRFDEASISRPLFANFANKKYNFMTDLRRQLSDHAELKLIPQQDRSDCAQLTTIVVMAARFGVLPGCQIMEAQMVASHMATLLAVSEDRSRISIRYLPEPMIGEAACQYLCSGDHFL